MSRKEIPTDPTHLGWLQESLGATDERFSSEERAELHDLVLSVYDQLDERDLWMINALLFERLSLRTVQEVLGIPKTTVARKRDQILRKLGEELSKHPIVKEYLYENSTDKP
jgi:DNA-directed RNA polymerase specialized sigma subunit